MEKSSVKTLQDLIRTAASEYGDKTFMKEKSGSEILETSFNTLYENTRRIASYVNELSGGEKLHAAVIGQTCSAYLSSYFGTSNSGNVIVPLDAQLCCEDIADHINRADVTLFFFDKRYIPMIESIRKLSPQIKAFVCLQENDKDFISCADIIGKYDMLPESNVSPEDCAAILYTSGTTGKSKGVMLSHGNLIHNTMCEDNESSTEDVLLSVLPIHHVYCFTCDILLTLRYGATICVNDSIMRIAQNLKTFEPSLILLVPMIADTICKKIKAAHEAHPELPEAAIARGVFGSKLKGIYSGGAYLPPELADFYRNIGIPIAQGYGMTETSPRITTGDLNDPSVGDVGHIVGGCEVKIVEGEIWAKSPSVMMGYYKNPEATAEMLTEDGWIRTGDLGYVENNHVYITGRKKNLIILSNGENVSPEELENKFAGIDWISEILVYAENGQITAEIFPNPEFKGDVAALFKEKTAQVNKTVSSAKAIRKLRIRNIEFEKTTSKKIKRQQTGEKGAEI
ncbi:MAG: AMP-binding protein [Huintestinicola sp.]